ncbi:hypothetical protein NKI30_20565 [Mesorhizobium opportunistum]|uniref:hypothetical protein n=1 Tax=Mesorhizobium opportunistum TaxID=593909 RepID=UPI00333C4A2D
MGNLGVAAYNGYETRSEDRLKAVNDLDLQRETAKSDLLLSAMRTNDSKAAQQNNLFFIDSGLIADPGDKLKKAVTKYFPVLPAPSGAVPSFLDPSDYAQAFWQVSLDASQMSMIDNGANEITAGRQTFETVAKATHAPWYVVGVVWMLETGGDFSTHLHNGDPLTAQTVHVPAGRPLQGQPPFTWEASAIDAIKLYKLDNTDTLDLGDMLDRLEGYNGYGYRRHQVSSPFLWAFTSGYAGGSYVADGVFASDVKWARPGAVALLRRLQDRRAINLKGTN